MRCGRILSLNPNSNLILNLNLSRDLYLSPNLNPNLGPYLNHNHSLNLSLDLYLNPNCPTLGMAIRAESPHRGRNPNSPITMSRSSRQHPKSGAPTRGPIPRRTPRP